MVKMVLGSLTCVCNGEGEGGDSFADWKPKIADSRNVLCTVCTVETPTTDHPLQLRHSRITNGRFKPCYSVYQGFDSRGLLKT